jgi:hypothetical protein
VTTVLEMLVVGAIVLVAACYSAWILMPVAVRQRLGRKLLPVAASAACPAWVARRIQAVAAGPVAGAGACDACSSSQPRDASKR